MHQVLSSCGGSEKPPKKTQSECLQCRVCAIQECLSSPGVIPAGATRTMALLFTSLPKHKSLYCPTDADLKSRDHTWLDSIIDIIRAGLIFNNHKFRDIDTGLSFLTVLDVRSVTLTLKVTLIRYQINLIRFCHTDCVTQFCLFMVYYLGAN